MAPVNFYSMWNIRDDIIREGIKIMSKHVTITLKAPLSDLGYYKAESGKTYVNLPFSTEIKIDGISAKASLYKGKLSIESIKEEVKATSKASNSGTELEGRVAGLESQLSGIATMLGQLVDQSKAKAKAKAKA